MKTVARLLLWWSAGPEIAEQGPSSYEDPHWWWLQRVQKYHEGWAWSNRYFELVEQLATFRTPAPPVSIDVPEEQLRLARALAEVAEAAGIDKDGWLRSGSTYRHLNIYLTGRRIPGNAVLWDFVSDWADRSDVEPLRDRLAAYHRLTRLADVARAARVRGRRVERTRLANESGSQ
ncbi:hypothetical protein OG795_00080 [[Kitasatospora] papulosa]|uniref:hypothetical protein n=1 Tax=[Kitasatospora] papulosa TaxID=1464011 RepID=UPI00324DD739